jgi:hypothetical protein
VPATHIDSVVETVLIVMVELDSSPHSKFPSNVTTWPQAITRVDAAGIATASADTVRTLVAEFHAVIW